MLNALTVLPVSRLQLIDDSFVFTVLSSRLNSGILPTVSEHSSLAYLGKCIHSSCEAL